jgi:hypothetical protein
MKKYIFAVFILFVCVNASATTVLYRISSGEVIGISATDSQFEMYGIEFGVLTNPTISDGTDFRDPNNDYRVLGYSKINDNGTIRNASQQEIDTFRPSQINDNNIKEALMAVQQFNTDPNLRRILTAFAAILVEEINILRNQHGLSDRTLQQLKTAIENRIDKDD